MERPQTASLPVTPGVYLYKDASGRILYVGKARNLRKRVLSYFRPPSALPAKTAAMLQHAVSLETLSTGTEKEALLLEASLIKRHRPHYNIILRDDKQYVLFRLDPKQMFPRLEIVRKARRDKARYFGPITSGKAARETWRAIHRAFPLRRCSDRAFHNRMRPCLYHHMGQCLAPCSLNVSPEAYAVLVHRVELLLSGRSRELLEQLEGAMRRASDNLEFEKAAELRDQLRAVESTVERQSVVLPEGGDMDVTGIVPVPGGLGLGLLFVREGRLVDGRTFFWAGLELEDAPELLRSFLGQFYGPGSSVPPRIVVPWLPDASDAVGNAEAAEGADPDRSAEALEDGDESMHAALEAALSELRGGPVRVAVPRNAAESGLVDMAGSNAREAARRPAATPLSGRLARALRLNRPVERIECVDVSHTGGRSTRVGMVVFEGGEPLPSAYRTYAVEDGEGGGDDFASLAEWMRRRLAEGPPWPDLVLIDGGRGQLSAVVRVLREEAEQLGAGPGVMTPPGSAEEEACRLFALAGIAKSRDAQGRPDRRAGNTGDRIFLPGRSNPLPLHDGCPELLFLQHVRDTAHHFVLGRHRKARAGAALTGELLRIPGVGMATAKLLWSHFPDLQAMTAASPEQLAAVPGIGPRKAAVLAERLALLRRT